MQPLDALSALTMGHHAADDDLLQWRWGNYNRAPRTTCKKHLLIVLHRSAQRGNAKKFAPGSIELMIMRDKLDDFLRRSKIQLFDVTRPGDRWEKCAHCRMEYARKYGHLQR